MFWIHFWCSNLWIIGCKYWYIPNLEDVMSWCHNDREFWPRFLVQGFELYDTDMQTILAQITFRNYDRSGDVCIQAGWYYANLQVDEQWCINSVYQSGTESIYRCSFLSKDESTKLQVSLHLCIPTARTEKPWCLLALFVMNITTA